MSRNQVMADDNTLIYVDDLELDILVVGGVTTISVVVGGRTYIQTLTVTGGATNVSKFIKQ